MSLYNEQGQPIQACNVFDANSKLHLFVEDEASYQDIVELNASKKSLSTILGVVFAVLLVVFTLNIRSSLLTSGNLVTLVILVGVFFYFAKTLQSYNGTSIILERMQKQGLPCTVPSKGGKKVFCSVWIVELISTNLQVHIEIRPFVKSHLTRCLSSCLSMLKTMQPNYAN